MKVLVSDNLSELGVQILRDAPGVEVDVKVGLSPEELIAIIPEYHGLAIRGATKVTAEVIGDQGRQRDGGADLPHLQRRGD
ncbi:MAG: phosphoglycerate dehydrogenase, partial [Desulfomonilaceae bacterium]